MPLLVNASYDPATAVSKSTASLLAMTALDTTNLRATFTAPSNGAVMVRMRCAVRGATTYPTILLGVMSGSTVVARVSPMGGTNSAAGTTVRSVQEALFTVTGLTPGTSYTWDAAYGVEVNVASTSIDYGGPNDTTTNNAWGQFTFEVWDAPTLLAGTLYDPTTAASKSTVTLTAMTALDTTNLRLTFTAPASGNVLVRCAAPITGATANPAILFGVLDGATVKARCQPLGGMKVTSVATGQVTQVGEMVITGLTPGSSYTYDLAMSVDIIVTSSALRYGGPNNTTTNDAFGGILFEIWSA